MRQVLLTVSVLALIVLVGSGLNAHFVTADPPAQPEPAVEPASLGQEYTLETAMRDGRMVYVGAGGAIDGVINPELTTQSGESVRVTLINGDGMLHDFSIEGLGVQTPLLSAKGATTDIVFSATQAQAGTYDYYCTVSGHRQAGMAGKFVVRR